MLTIDEIIRITNGKLVQKQDSFVYGVSTDSRTIQKGDLFIPLQGENFDGHQFIPDVAKKGAGCILVSKEISTPPLVTMIRVQDTLKALQDLAIFYRKNHPFKIVAITGSNGKTTTKFFSEAILSSQFRVYASQKSFNNHIGVPLTLLSLKPETQIGLVEIGMNHPGEIGFLTKIADPDISIVTTVGRAHLMDFGSEELIAKEKCEIYKQARAQNLKIFNLDNFHTQKAYEEYKQKQNVICFSAKDSGANVHFELESMSLREISIRGSINGVSGQKKISVFGQQNIANLMAASSVALACGMSPQQIWEALDRCRTVWGRNQIIDLKSGAKLIFDGYNANPDSMKVLIENLSVIDAKKKILILGDMLEMGGLAESLHEELGRLAGEKQFDVIWFLGQYSKFFEAGVRSSKFQKNLFISDGYEEPLAVKVSNMVENSDVVAMKGSRGARLERLVTHFSPLNWETK